MSNPKFRFNIEPLKYRRRQLRIDSTDAEKIFWEAVRNKKLGVRFVRQFSVDGYVIDFYCPKLRLGFELEGGIHNKADVKKYDKYRESYLSSFSIRIVKITNEEVVKDLKKLLIRISPLLGQERGKG